MFFVGNSSCVASSFQNEVKIRLRNWKYSILAVDHMGFRFVVFHTKTSCVEIFHEKGLLLFTKL